MKQVINFIKELRKKPYGKAVIFFSVYFLLFLGLAIFSRVSPNNGRNTNKNSNLNILVNKKYSFNYNVNVDDSIYSYDGSRNNTDLEFIYNGEKYSLISGKYYKNGDNSTSVDNPMKFEKFFIEENITQIIQSSYLESQTTYGDGRVVFNYLISSNTINKLLEGKDTDFSEVPNKVTLTKINNSLEKIVYELDSYCKLNNLCNKGLKITISYSY